MQTSIFAAKLIGPAVAIMGVAMLVNRENFIQAAREVIESRAHLLMAGVLALVLGLVLVNTHNEWAFGWPLMITLLGWLSIASGVVRLVFPDLVRRLGDNMISDGAFMSIAATLWVLLGAVLSYYGYLA